MASVSSSNTPQASRGGGVPAMLPSGARGGSNRGSAIPLPPGAQLVKGPYPFGGGRGAAGLMGPPSAAVPPGFRGKGPPAQMLMMAGNQKMLVPPPSSLLAAGGGHSLATSPPLSRSTSPGTMTAQPGPPGRGPIGPPHSFPQLAFVNGKKIMMPPGMKLLMGGPGPGQVPGATAAAAPPQAVMHSKMMMPPGQGWGARRRSSPTASPPPGVMSRGAAAAATGGGGSPSPLRVNPGQSPVRPPMQAAALPSPPPPQPQPTRVATAGAAGSKSHKFDLVRRLANALSSLKSGSASDRERENEQLRPKVAALQQRVQTPPGLDAREKGVGGGPAGPHSSSTWMPRSRSLPHPAGQAPPRKQQPMAPPQLMSNAKMMVGQPPASPRGKSPTPMSPAKSGNASGGAGAAAAAAAAAPAPASSPMRMPPGQLMAIKGCPGRGGVVGGAKNAIMGSPPPGAGRSMAAASPPAVRLAPSPQQQLQHPSPAGPRLVKCIVGPPPPHERLIPAPSPQQPQQQSHSRSTSPPTASLPSPPLPATLPPAAAAAANTLRVPSSTVLKDDQLPEAGVRSPGHRLRRLGESSEDSDSNGGDGGGGAHAGAQVAAASHSDGPGHLRNTSLVKDTDGAVGTGTAQESAAEEEDAALHENDKTQPPRPSSSSPPRHAAARQTRDHSHHRGDGDCNDGAHHTTGAMTSKSASAGAGAGAAATSQSSSSAHRDSNNKASASTILQPVRQTATTAARSAAAAAKRRQEEEERRHHEAAGKDALASKKLRSSRSKSAPRAKHASPPQPAAAAGVAREPPSPQEEDNTQKPSSVESSIHSIASTASCRAPLSPSGSSTPTLGDKKSPRTPTRGRGRAVGGGDGFAAPPGSASTRSGKRPGKAAHFDPSDTQKNGQWQRQPRSIRSKPRSRSTNARRSTSRGRSGNDDGDSSDADDEEDGESGLEKLTSRDLYRLAKLLRDGNADVVGADVDDRQRSGRRWRSHHRGDNRSDRGSDADSSDAGSWGRQRRGRQRRQHTTAKRRSALPLTTVGIPWRYAGTRRSLEPFASPPRVRRPLGYINVGGGRYARVGGSPYTRSQSRPRAASVGTVPLDTTNTRTLVSDAAAYGSYSPLSGERNRWASALLDAFRNAAVAEVQRSALLDSQPASSARSGGTDGGAAALYYSSQQRPRFGARGSPPHPHTRDGCSAPGGGLDDTMSSAAESQHPYCVSTSALLSAMPSTAPLRRGTAPAYEQNEQERGRSSPPSGPLRWAAVQPYSLPSQPRPPTSAAAVTEPVGLLRLDKDKADPAVEPNTHGTVAAAVNDAAAPVRVASWRWSSFSDQPRGPLPATSTSVDATRAAAAATRSRSVTSNRRSSISRADTASVSAAAPTLSSLIPTFMTPKLLAPPWERAWLRGIGNHLHTPSPSTEKRWLQEQRHAQRSKSCNAANNSRTCNSAAAAAAAATAHAGRHTSDANLDACGSPARKEEPVYLSKATVARLSTPRQRRGSLGTSAATAISPISRRSHGGVDGISSVTAQTCSKWLDEIIDSTTVTATCVRAGGGAGGGGDHAVAAANAIPVVDLRREFKPRIADGDTDGRGGPSSVRAASPSLHDGGTTDYTQEFTGSRARPHVPGISFKYMIGARSATGSPPRTGGKAAAAGGGAVNVKTVKGISDGLPFSAYSSIRIHDPARKSPWALAPEREGLKVLPGQPALSRRRRIPADGHAAAENGAADSGLGVHEANDARHRARGATRTVVEEVHLDEHRRPYLIVRPVPSSEEGEAQRVAVERLSRPKSIYCRANDHV